MTLNYIFNINKLFKDVYKCVKPTRYEFLPYLGKLEKGAEKYLHICSAGAKVNCQDDNLQFTENL